MPIEIIFLMISFILSTILIVIVAKKANKRIITQLANILILLNKEDEIKNIKFNIIEAKWKGELNNKIVELEYSSSSILLHDYLKIKVPYITKRIFYLSNVNMLINKKTVEEQSNQICLSYIKNEEIKTRLNNFLKDERFNQIKTRKNINPTKFPLMPYFDENNKIINDKNEKVTDTLAISLAILRDKKKRNKDTELSYEFIISALEILWDVKKELDKKNNHFYDIAY